MHFNGNIWGHMQTYCMHAGVETAASTVSHRAVQQFISYAHSLPVSYKGTHTHTLHYTRTQTHRQQQ